MTTLKKILSAKPQIWFCLSALLLCTCVQLPDHCSDQNPYNPGSQFCFSGAAVDKCGGKTFDPATQGCELSSGTVREKCSGGRLPEPGQNCDGTPVTPTYTLTVSADTGGTVDPSAQQSGITAGTQISISATANDGYDFSYWTISGSGTIESPRSAATSVTVTGNVIVTANFTQKIGCTEWGEWALISPATCDGPGLQTRTCTAGASGSETQNLPAQLSGEECEHGGGLVLSSGDRWVMPATEMNDDFEMFSRVAIGFHANGTMEYHFEFVNNIWVLAAGFMGIADRHYFTKRDTLYIVTRYCDDVDECSDMNTSIDTSMSTYTITGNTLRVIGEYEECDWNGSMEVCYMVTDTMTLTRTQVDVSKGLGALNEALFGKAWVDANAEGMWMFEAEDGIGIAVFMDINEASTNEDYESEMYLCGVSGSTMTLIPIIVNDTGFFGTPKTVTYSLSGNTLKIDGVNYIGMDSEVLFGKSRLSKVAPKVFKLPKVLSRR